MIVSPKKLISFAVFLFIVLGLNGFGCSKQGTVVVRSPSDTAAIPNMTVWLNPINNDGSLDIQGEAESTELDGVTVSIYLNHELIKEAIVLTTLLTDTINFHYTIPEDVMNGDDVRLLFEKTDAQNRIHQGIADAIDVVTTALIENIDFAAQASKAAEFFLERDTTRDTDNDEDSVLLPNASSSHRVIPTTDNDRKSRLPNEQATIFERDQPQVTDQPIESITSPNNINHFESD